jgi:hypothetical protein
MKPEDDMDAIVYRCTGVNEHGAACNKTLFVYRPPLTRPGALRPDLGTVEQKCRRCKMLNVFRLADYETALRGLQDH